jgi:peptidyl-prolyl cis-trans isomerase D
MMTFLRSQSKAVILLFLAIMGLGFLFYGNSGNLLTEGGGRVNNDFGRIDGDDLNLAELSDAVRNERNAFTIFGQADKLRTPGASAQLARLAWRQLLLLHEADRLHITVSDRELVDFIRSLPMFQKNGVYDPATYETTMRTLGMVLRLAPDSGTDATAAAKTAYVNVLRNQLRAEAVSKTLFGNVHSSTQDVTSQYQKLYGPIAASTVTIDAKSFLASAQVTPEEIAAEYKANPNNPSYRTAEKRKVDYVLMTLTPDQAKLPDAQKKAAKDALGQKALDFVLAFQPDPSATPDAAAAHVPDFKAQAQKQGLTPETTDFFTADSTPAGVPPSPSFSSAAFALSKDAPVSKVVELENGVAVLHLAEIQPSDLKPLDQVRGDIQKTLQERKSGEAARVAAEIAATSLQAAASRGIDFKTEAASLKLPVTTLPPFIPMKVGQSDPKLQVVGYATLQLAPGEVSKPVPTEGGGYLIAHVDSRGTPDPAGLGDFEKTARERQDNQLRDAVAEDWANWKSKQSGTHPPADLESYGTIE